MDSAGEKIPCLPHHKQESLCTTRPPYRQGRKLTAVKVYTVNDESVHLLIHGVPSIGLESEVLTLCERYGRLKSIKLVEKDPSDQEEFTNVFHVQFERIQSARFAKKILDNRSFFGGVLHVCYAPELETVNETKLKLVNRKREIARRTRNMGSDQPKNESKMTDTDEDAFKASYQEKFSLGNSIPSNSEAKPSCPPHFHPVPPQEISVNVGPSLAVWQECGVQSSYDSPPIIPIHQIHEANKDCDAVRTPYGSTATLHVCKNLEVSSTQVQSDSSKLSTSSIDPQVTPEQTLKKIKTASSPAEGSPLDTSALGPSQPLFKKFKSHASRDHHNFNVTHPYSALKHQHVYRKYSILRNTQQHDSFNQGTSLSALPSTSFSQEQAPPFKTSATAVSESAPNPLKRRVFETKFLPRSLAIKKKKE